LRFARRGRHRFSYFSLPYRRYYYSYPPYYYDPYDRDGYDSPDEKLYDTPYDEQGEYERQEAEKLADVDEVNRHLDYIADVFAVGEYAKAVLRAKRAVKAEPDSAVLRFVYSQTLFADEEYKRAAVVLRQALEKTDLEKEGVFFAIGFYPDESVLTEQIDTLIDAAQAESSRADLQLLLGYQLLGLSRFDEALEAFQKAKQDYVNRRAAAILIGVLEKTRKASEINTPLQEQSNEPPQGD
jgi:hypothetical protein